VLRIQRHDARIAHAVELDAPAFAAGIGQALDGALHRLLGRRIAVAQQRGHGVVDDLDDDVAGLVVVVHRAVHKGHAFVDAAGQLELEVRQAVVAHTAAKAHHRGLAHMRAFGQFHHRQRGKGPRVGQQQFGHPLFGWRQGGNGSADAFEHGVQS
jgi:hypothetical protein